MEQREGRGKELRGGGGRGAWLERELPLPGLRRWIGMEPGMEWPKGVGRGGGDGDGIREKGRL